MPDHQLVFAPFRLDLANEQLWEGENLIPLRPKVFATLRYLLENAGRLVTREELHAAVWSTAVVSDSVLRGVVRELREMLGDDADTVRFIETIPRRGYRFLPTITTLSLTSRQHSEVNRKFAETGGQKSEARPLDFSSQHPAPSTQDFVLVGRHVDLACLHTCLAKARNGKRQLIFVTGEPGIGKSTLMETFLHDLASRSPEAALGRGQCIEHYGAGEAYLPVLEAFGRLCRQPGGEHIVTLLGRYAPTWLMQMPALIPDSKFEVLQRKVQGATRERMLREMAEALEALTQEIPLVLVLEDLHWSDVSTLDLLAALARRRESARLLLIGTYRPADLILSGHPLRAMKQELQAHGYCEELSLGFLNVAEVTQYLSERFPQQQFPTELGRVLHQNTEGNPLFMVNVVDDWVNQGVLREVGGRWKLTVKVEALAASMPESLRQIIEKQLTLLTSEEQRLMEAASVIGSEFSTATLASGLEEQLGRTEECCEGLAKRAQFLRAKGTLTFSDGTVTGQYEFMHTLYQQVLYDRLTPVRRVHLHRRLAIAEEAAYGAQAEDHAAELAVHFERGHAYARAVHYCHQAGQHARQRFATVEALQHFRRGLALLPALPETREHQQFELSLLLALGTVIWATDPELGVIYARANLLAQQLALPAQRFLALDGLVRWHFLRGEFPRARELGEQALTLTQELNDPALHVKASAMMAAVMLHSGAPQAACDGAAAVISSYDTLPSRSTLAQYGQDPKASVMSAKAIALWLLGYPEQARQQSLEALQWARELVSPFGIVLTHCFVTIIHQCLGFVSAVREWAETGVPLADEYGSRLWEGISRVLWGWSEVIQGQQEVGWTQLRKGETLLQSLEGRMFHAYTLSLLAEAHGCSGQIGPTLSLVDEALADVEQTGERFWEAELWRLKGELLLQWERGTTPKSQGAEQRPKGSKDSKAREANRSRARSVPRAL